VGCVVYPQIASTDLNDVRVLATFGKAGRGNPASVGAGLDMGAARGGVTRASWEAWAVNTWVNVSARFCSR
jgi:hypothetical protein